MARPLQGTATNNESVQTLAQRAGDHFAFSANITASSLFPKAPDPEQIMNKAYNRSSITPHSNIPAGENPDFNEGITNLELYGFEKGGDKFRSVASAKDNPYVFGTNLITPDIKRLPDDNGPDTVGQEQSSTAMLTQTAEPQSDFETKGFGTETFRNDPRNSSRVTSFIGRRGRESENYGSNKLGEWWDTTKYDYSELPPEEPSEDETADE